MFPTCQMGLSDFPFHMTQLGFFLDPFCSKQKLRFSRFQTVVCAKFGCLRDMKHHPQRGYVGAWERLPSDRALCDAHVFCSAVCVTPFTSPWWGEVRWGLLSVCQAQTDTSVDIFIAYPSYHEFNLASSNMKVPLWWYSTKKESHGRRQKLKRK